MLTVVLGDYAAEGKKIKISWTPRCFNWIPVCFGALLIVFPHFSRVKLPAIYLLRGTNYASFWITACLLVGGGFWLRVRQPPHTGQSDPLPLKMKNPQAIGRQTCPIAGASDSPLNSSTKCWGKELFSGFRAIKLALLCLLLIWVVL